MISLRSRRLRRLATRRFLRRRRLVTLSLNRQGEADYPLRRARLRPQITDADIRLPGLPAAYDGLRIVHLSDIHHSLLVNLREVERVVELVNECSPDLVALTGDYVTLSAACIWPVARALGRLKAKQGVFAVLGNHDFQVGADAITRAFRAQQIQVLRNEHHALRSPAGTLWVLGVDDLWWKEADLAAAQQGIPRGEPKRLLCHNPDIIGQASRSGIDLVLSGHTHGGQIRLPWKWAESVYGRWNVRRRRRFVRGWGQLGGIQIYINRGIGTIWVPLRVACPPKIACLHLRKGLPS